MFFLNYRNTPQVGFFYYRYHARIKEYKEKIEACIYKDFRRF